MAMARSLFFPCDLSSVQKIRMPAQKHVGHFLKVQYIELLTIMQQAQLTSCQCTQLQYKTVTQRQWLLHTQAVLPNLYASTISTSLLHAASRQLQDHLLEVSNQNTSS